MVLHNRCRDGTVRRAPRQAVIDGVVGAGVIEDQQLVDLVAEVLRNAVQGGLQGSGRIVGDNEDADARPPGLALESFRHTDMRIITVHLHSPGDYLSDEAALRRKSGRSGYSGQMSRRSIEGIG